MKKAFVLFLLFAPLGYAAELAEDLQLGGFSKKNIESLVAKKLPEIARCYEARKKKKSDVGGRVEVRFIISPEGFVSSATVEKSTLKSSAVEKCLTDVVHQILFPMPKGGGVVEILYPFLFSPSKPTK